MSLRGGCHKERCEGNLFHLSLGFSLWNIPVGGGELDSSPAALPGALSVRLSIPGQCRVTLCGMCIVQGMALSICVHVTAAQPWLFLTLTAVRKSLHPCVSLHCPAAPHETFPQQDAEKKILLSYLLIAHVNLIFKTGLLSERRKNW